MSEQLSECCVSGHVHEGTPKGSLQTVYGLETYVTGSTTDASKTIIFITDIFGHKLPNAQLLADEIAQAVPARVLVPDFFQGDALDHSLMQKIAPRSTEPERSIVQKTADTASVAANLGPWLLKHREAVSKPLIEDYVKQVRQDSSVQKVGATGYCWGGRYAILLADGQVDCAVGCHPSFLAVPSDLTNVRKPVSIAVGDKDDMFPVEEQKKAEDYFGRELKDVKTELVVYPDAVHGFACRGDYSVDKDKHDKEQATKQTVQFFQSHL